MLTTAESASLTGAVLRAAWRRRDNPLPPRRGGRGGGWSRERGRSTQSRLFRGVELFPGILGHRQRLELDIGEMPAALLHTADIDVLHDIARLRIDHDLAARAVRILPAFERCHRLVGVDIALVRFD